MLSTEKVRNVAHLAHLTLSDDELEQMRQQLNDILKYMEKLNELNTEGVEPTSHAIALETAFREDEVIEPVGQERALQNAPDHDNEFFRVPAVIE